jgi:hypothetical protein
LPRAPPLWQDFEFRQALAAPRLGVAFRKLFQNGQIIHALFLKGLATDDTAAVVLLRPVKDFHRFGFEIWNPRNQENSFSLFLARRAPGFQIHFKICEGIRVPQICGLSIRQCA